MRPLLGELNRWKKRYDSVVAMSTVLRVGLCLLAMGCTKESAPEAPVIAELPGFELVDQDGRAFTRDSLEGSIWVTSFVFTHCRATCPRLMAQMKKLQGRLEDVEPAIFFVGERGSAQ
jgi:cytochrome oxidase Cu insertion factor (SCO1/SenC/PrrC family)